MRILLSLLTSVLVVTSVAAQSSSQSSRQVSTTEVRKYWEEGGLSSLDELTSPVLVDSMDYALRWNCELVKKSERFPHNRIYYLQFKPYIVVSESWFKPELKTPLTKQFCDIVFDILEIESRKATMEFARHPVSEVLGIDQTAKMQTRQRIKDLYFVTEGATNAEKLRMAENMVKKELAATKVDVRSIKTDPVYTALAVNVGYGVQVPFTDYFEPAWAGVNFGLGYSRQRHLFKLGLQLGHSECDQLIPASNMDIQKGEGMQLSELQFGYGYQLNPGSTRPFYPVVGVGINTLMGTSQEIDGKMKFGKKEGVMFSLGCQYDLPFYTVRELYGENMVNNHSIQIKPYLSFLHFADGIGWVPSINLAVSYNLAVLWCK